VNPAHLQHSVPTDVCFSFTGSAGQAIITKDSAYLITDSRYWLQAREQLDPNWDLVEAGAVNGPKDWIEWLVVSYIGIPD